MGAPYEMNGAYQTGDVYKCSLSKRTNGNGCAKLNLGAVLQNTPRFLKEHHEKSPNTDRDHHKCKMNACFVKLFTTVPACFSPHVSVNIMMTCVRQKCGYHTMHATFYYFF